MWHMNNSVVKEFKSLSRGWTLQKQTLRWRLGIKWERNGNIAGSFHVCVLSHSVMSDSLWTVAFQAPLSMRFSR